MEGKKNLCAMIPAELHARIMAENTTDCYYYVPALMLWGKIEYCGETTGETYFNIADNHILCINAVDGSIIG